MKEHARQEQEVANAWREAVAHEEPPPALDARIRAAAHAALPVRRRPRYFVPLALAASVVVAVGLGLRQQRGEAPLPASPSMAPAAPPPAAGARVEKAVPRLVAPAKEEARAEAPRTSAPATAEVATPADGTQTPSAPGQQAAANAESSAPPAYAGAGRGDLRLEPEAGAVVGDATLEPDAVVVATIRALLTRGERDAAVNLAREYAARRPVPPALPEDLRVLLDAGTR